MKNRKIAKALVALTLGVVSAAGLCFGATACGEDHKHTYSKSWSSNAEGHWHQANCEHKDLKDEVKPHDGIEEDGKCDTCEYEVPVASVSVDETKTLKVGDAPVKLNATIAPTNAYNKQLEWESSNTAVATVSNGVVTVVGKGETTITVKAHGTEITDTCVITVTDNTGSGTGDDKPDTPPAPTKTLYETLMERQDHLLAEDWEERTADEKLALFDGDYSKKGIYSYTKAEDEAHYAKVTANTDATNKHAELIDPDPDKTKGGTAEMILALGKTQGTVEGYMEVTFIGGGNSWSFVQFQGTDGDEIFRLRTDTSIKYSVDAGTTYVAAAAGNEVKMEAAGKYQIYYKLETVAEEIKMTVTVNGKPLAEAVTVRAGLAGIKFVTSDSGAKRMTVDNIVVCGTEYPASAHAVDVKALLATEVAKYPATSELPDAKVYSINAAAITKIKEDCEAAIDAAVADTAKTNTEKLAAIDEAYKAAVAALEATEDDATVQAARTAAKTALEAYDGGSENYTENAADYTAKLEEGKALIDGANSSAAIAEKLAEAKALIDGLDSDKEILVAYKATAKESIPTKVTAALEGVSVDDMAKIQAQVDAAKTEAEQAIEGAHNKAEVDAAITELEQDLAAAKASLTKTFDEVKADAIAAITAKLNEYKTTYAQETEAATMLTEVETVANEYINTNIPAITEEGDGTKDGKTLVAEAQNAAEAAMEAKVDAYELAKYKVTLCAEIDAEAAKIETHQNQGYSDAVAAAVTAGKALVNADTVVNKTQADEEKATALTNLQAVVTEWTAKTFTVSFNGATVTQISVKFGETATEPETKPTAENKKFEGWYKDAEFQTKFDFATEVIYDDTTIYVNWTEADVTINFHVGDKIVKTIKAFSDETPSDANFPADAIKSGMKFKEWRNSDLTAAFALPTAYEANQTLDAYAYFDGYKTSAEIAPASWIIADDTEAVAGQKPADLSVIKDTNLFTVGTDEAKPTGYATFTAVDKKDNLHTTTLMDGSTSSQLNKVWSGINLQKGTTAESNIIITAKENITLYVYMTLTSSKFTDSRYGEIYYTLNTTDRTNAAKVGDIEQGANKVCTVEITINAGDTAYLYVKNTCDSGASYSLYGVEAKVSDKFTNTTVNFHYDTDDVETVGYNCYGTYTVAAPADRSDPSNANGDQFLGWSKDKGQTEQAAVVDLATINDLTAGGTLDLYPVFKQAAVVITFMVNDGKGSTTQYAKIGIDENAPVELPDAPTPHEGYRFVGWFTDATYATPIDPATTYSAAATIYGLCEKIPYVTVTYMNGANQLSQVTDAINGEKITAPEAPAAAEGYRFAGWYTDAALTTQFSFESNLAVEPAEDDTRSLTLYAGFKVIHSQKDVEKKDYTVTCTSTSKTNIDSGSLLGEAFTITYDSSNKNKPQTTSSYLSSKSVTGLKMSFSTPTANAVLTINDDTAVERLYTVYRVASDGTKTEVGKKTKKGSIDFPLTDAGDYVIEFSALEHKIKGLVLSVPAYKLADVLDGITATAKADCTTATALTDAVTVKANVTPDNGTPKQVDLTEGYTVLLKNGGTALAEGENELVVIYGTGKTLADANALNSVTVTVTVATAGTV